MVGGHEEEFAECNIQILAQLNRGSSGDDEHMNVPSTTLRRSLFYESLMDVEKEDVTLYAQHRGKVGAIDTFKHYLRMRGRKWAKGQAITAPQTFMAVIDARHMIVEPHIFINQVLSCYFLLRSLDFYNISLIRPCHTLQLGRMEAIQKDLLPRAMSCWFNTHNTSPMLSTIPSTVEMAFIGPSTSSYKTSPNPASALVPMPCGTLLTRIVDSYILVMFA